MERRRRGAQACLSSVLWLAAAGPQPHRVVQRACRDVVREKGGVNAMAWWWWWWVHRRDRGEARICGNGPRRPLLSSSRFPPHPNHPRIPKGCAPFPSPPLGKAHLMGQGAWRGLGGHLRDPVATPPSPPIRSRPSLVCASGWCMRLRAPHTLHIPKSTHPCTPTAQRAALYTIRRQ